MKGIFLRREWVSLVCCFCIIGGCLVHTALGKETKALFPMMGVRVVLDAGHGGWDPGKTGTGGENEKILNLAVTEKLTEYLEQGGAEVILTRNADTALGGSELVSAVFHLVSDVLICNSRRGRLNWRIFVDRNDLGLAIDHNLSLVIAINVHGGAAGNNECSIRNGAAGGIHIYVVVNQIFVTADLDNRDQLVIEAGSELLQS